MGDSGAAPCFYVFDWICCFDFGFDVLHVVCPMCFGFLWYTFGVCVWVLGRFRALGVVLCVCVCVFVYFERAIDPRQAVTYV